jgi:hypothetical protein
VGYTTAMWLGFGEALAAVAGALTGLLGGVVNAWLFLVKATS